MEKKKKKLEREKTGIVCTFASTDDQYCNDLNVKIFVVFSQSLLRVHSTLGNVHISRLQKGMWRPHLLLSDCLEYN